MLHDLLNINIQIKINEWEGKILELFSGWFGIKNNKANEMYQQEKTKFLLSVIEN